MNLCALDGYLVRAGSPLPTEPSDYYVENLPIVGCNRLRCSQCKASVRHAVNLKFRNEHAQVDLKPLYEVIDLATSPLLGTSPGARLYLCRCHRHVAYKDSALGEPDREWNSVPHLSCWKCEGHPIVTLPHEFDGVLAKTESDLIELCTRSLQGFRPPAAHPEDKPRALWTARLYARLKQTPWADTVVRTAASCLTDPVPQVRARAMEFFFCLELPAHRAVELLDADRHLFTGVPDEITAITGDKTLEDTLFRVITPLVKEPGRARDLARAEALAPGKGRCSLYDALAAGDSEWVAAHAEDIARATPALGTELIESCQYRFPRIVPSRPVCDRLRAFLASNGQDPR